MKRQVKQWVLTPLRPNQILNSGSFICDCLDTFVKDKKTKECVCADGYENKDGECVDINECDDDPCGENEVCF